MRDGTWSSTIKYYLVLGHLREIDDEGNMTDNGFKFDVFESKAENQKRYEEIGQIMDSVVYELLVKEGKLEKLLVK